MSGHNKWSKVKNVKGKEDAKRAKIFSKMSRTIAVAVREGGPDPNYNPSLKAAIEKARAENMPNDNIERAIKKGNGELGDADYEEFIYEGYGPEGVAVIVSCLSDNRNRTAPNIRHYFDKYGGNLGQSGSVSFLFERKGLLVISDDFDEEAVMMDALECGAEDVKVEDGVYEVYSSVENFNDMRDCMQERGYKFEAADLYYIPLNEMSLPTEESKELMEKLIDALEDDDDVQSVYHNWDGE